MMGLGVQTTFRRCVHAHASAKPEFEVAGACRQDRQVLDASRHSRV